jgi:membrane protease YdiL (CAAX protease family)
MAKKHIFLLFFSGTDFFPQCYVHLPFCVFPSFLFPVECLRIFRKGRAMNESPLGIFVSFALAAFVGCLWWKDYRANRRGNAEKSAEDGAFLPGATSCPVGWVAAGVAGALLLVLLETAGEGVLEISAAQKDITALFLVAMLSAAVVEEVVFRGYLVEEGRGRGLFLGSIVGASLVFALLHDFLWQYHEVEAAAWWEFWRGFSTNFTLKGIFSFGFVLAGSLFFYALRFHPRNRAHSLIPCFAAHAAKNLAVFLVKLLQGHIVGWW